MDYFTWSQEYFQDAENLRNTISKYEKYLSEGKVQNLELINSIILNYKNIYYDMINTAKYLESKALEHNNAA